MSLSICLTCGHHLCSVPQASVHSEPQSVTFSWKQGLCTSSSISDSESCPVCPGGHSLLSAPPSRAPALPALSSVLLTWPPAEAGAYDVRQGQEERATP